MCSIMYVVILLSCMSLTIGQETEPPEAYPDETTTTSSGLTEYTTSPDLTTLITPDETVFTTGELTGTETSFNPKVRIVGGDVAADRSRFAYQASMRMVRANFHFCGAAIIHRSHALSAAHCVYNEAELALPSSINLVVGDLNTRQEMDTTVYRSISRIFAHPDYSHVTFQNDVAVLRMSQALDDWTAYVNFLPMSSSTPADGTTCMVSGWGTTSSDGPASDALRFVAVPIVSRATCSTRYGNTIMDGMLCAGFMEGGRDACQGDSGGPLVCNNELAGVVSWGYGCAAAGFPGIYADVALYKSWIEEQIERDPPVEDPEPVTLANFDDSQLAAIDVHEERKPGQATRMGACGLIISICVFAVLT